MGMVMTFGVVAGDVKAGVGSLVCSFHPTSLTPKVLLVREVFFTRSHSMLKAKVLSILKAFAPYPIILVF